MGNCNKSVDKVVVGTKVEGLDRGGVATELGLSEEDMG